MGAELIFHIGDTDIVQGVCFGITYAKEKTRDAFATCFVLYNYEQKTHVKIINDEVKMLIKICKTCSKMF